MKHDFFSAACRLCKRELDAKNAFYCPDCYAALCADCAKKSGSLCPHCFSPLNRFS